MAIEQVHYEPDAIHHGPHPDPTARAYAEEHFISPMQSSREEFLSYLETAPNLNEKYAAELATVQEVFAGEGLEAAPITVLNSEQYAEAIKIGSSDESNDQDSDGAFSFGRIIIRERVSNSSGKLNEQSSRRLVIGIALHEGGHSTAGEPDDLVVSKTVARSSLGMMAVQEEAPDEMTRFFYGARHLVGFRRFELNGKTGVIKGNFQEEAFADLTRVRNEAKLGIGSSLPDGQVLNFDIGVTFVADSAESQLPGQVDGYLTVPAQFASLIDVLDDGTPVTVVKAPNIAAYGLNLLDREMPGLYEEIKASRADSSRIENVQAMINQVKPGLYEELDSLQYTDDDFVESLRLINEAIRSRRGEPSAEQRAHTATAMARDPLEELLFPGLDF